jgi:hypothetical protein
VTGYRIVVHQRSSVHDCVSVRSLALQVHVRPCTDNADHCFLSDMPTMNVLWEIECRLMPMNMPMMNVPMEE